MISTLQSPTDLERVKDLDQVDEMRRVAIECYTLAIRSVSQYAPEVAIHQVADFRSHLKDLERQWKAARSPGGLHAVQASFRGELREYRDQTREHLAHLRQELEGAAAAMDSFARGVAVGGADWEVELERELKRLEEMSASSDLLQMRGGIRAAVGEIATSVDQMRRGNQMIMAQLKDEIRLLHQEFASERRALFTDPVSSAWTRAKLDLKINEMLRQNDRFCIIAISIQNLPLVKVESSRSVLEGTLKALLTRFRGMFGDETKIGRWSEDQFVMILDVDPAALPEIGAEMVKKLSGPYSVQENGMAHHVALDLATAGLERVVGSDPVAFIRQLDHLTNERGAATHGGKPA